MLFNSCWQTTAMCSLVAGLISMSCPAQAQIIVAHRGASHDAPENTLAAFRLAWEQEADGIECDFRLSRDGHIVCIHDDTTERTGGRNLDVAKSTLSELQQLDVGSWKDKRFANERIPTLTEVLATVPHDKQIVIELKTGPEIVAPLRQALGASTLPLAQVLVISFDQKTIAESKRVLPDLRTHWLSGYKPDDDVGPWTPTSERIAQTVLDTGADGFGSQARRNVFDPRFMGELKAAGIDEIHVWTVDDPDDARYYQQLGVYGITTNRPALIRQELKNDSR